MNLTSKGLPFHCGDLNWQGAFEDTTIELELGLQGPSHPPKSGFYSLCVGGGGKCWNDKGQERERRKKVFL